LSLNSDFRDEFRERPLTKYTGQWAGKSHTAGVGRSAPFANVAEPKTDTYEVCFEITGAVRKIMSASQIVCLRRCSSNPSIRSMLRLTPSMLGLIFSARREYSRARS